MRKPTVRKPRGAKEVPSEPRENALKITGLVKRFGEKTAVAGIDLEIAAGSFF